MSEFSFIAQTPHTAFLFPGQGSQQVGMGQELARTYPVARATFEEADDLLGFPLSQLCFEGLEAELTDTVNAQPALLVTSVAILRAVASELGGRALPTGDSTGATFVAGHSMGEYSALVAAGSLTFADGLRLVRRRGELMKAAGTEQPGLMAAVLGLDEAQATTICAEATAAGGIAQVANDNCPGQVVISGDHRGMEAAMAALAAAGARKIVPLAVSIAAHSPLMQPVAEALAQEIDATPMMPPMVPVIGNTQAQPLTSVAAIRAELAAQLTGSVRWTASMQTALAAGVTRFVEIGPGDVLAGLMRRIDRNAQRETIHISESVRSFVASLIG
ncbi:MAG: [acyl-carrier-protein] S-malonyltransferase [Chloroflexi bacterium]|nr:MAG: [acyl-carrier-protein] S-malonyltransferase [Chloroflexota bacterium]